MKHHHIKMQEKVNEALLDVCCEQDIFVRVMAYLPKYTLGAHTTSILDVRTNGLKISMLLSLSSYKKITT